MRGGPWIVPYHACVVVPSWYVGAGMVDYLWDPTDRREVESQVVRRAKLHVSPRTERLSRPKEGWTAKACTERQGRDWHLRASPRRRTDAKERPLKGSPQP